jgi:AsmA protein
VTPDSGIAGVVNFDGTVTSNGHQAQADGSGNLAKWKVSPKGSPSPKPVDLKFSTHYELQKQSGTLNADVTVGKAVAKLTGTYETQGATTTLDIKLAADNMPVDDLEALLPAMGVTLPSGSRLEGGTLTANFTIQGPVDKLVINGPVQMVNTKLAGFDLGSKFSAISALSGAKTGQDTVIQNFSTDAHVSPQGIQTQNVNLNVPSIGLITGNGTISPQDALNYKMNAKLGGSASMVGGLTQMAGLGNKSGTIPFSIEGTTSDPKIVPDIKGMLGNQFNPAGKGSNPLSGISGLLGNKKH